MHAEHSRQPAGPDRDDQHAAHASSTTSTPPSAGSSTPTTTRCSRPAGRTSSRAGSDFSGRSTTSTSPTRAATSTSSGTARSGARCHGQTDTGTYGYYHVDDFGTRGKVGGNIISLYAQDTWSVTPRLVLNLGLRTENEKVPSFRPDIKANAFEFSFADKMAPRLGASFDVRGDGKVKLSGSWGRYFDWTKYSIVARLVRRRPLAHLLPFARHAGHREPEPQQHAGPRFVGQPDRLPRSARDAVRGIDPNTKPMYQDSTNVGVEFQLSPTTVVTSATTCTTISAARSRISARWSTATTSTRSGTLVRDEHRCIPRRIAPTPNFPMPKPKRQYDALELSVSRRFSKNWFASANYTLSRLYGNYTGLADSDEILTPTTGVVRRHRPAVGRQHRPSRAATPTPRGTPTRFCGIRTGTSTSSAGCRRIGRMSSSCMASYTFPFGTQLGVFFYGGSGTPISTVVNSQDLEPLLVNGRGDMGRTPVLDAHRSARLARAVGGRHQEDSLRAERPESSSTRRRRRTSSTS